MAFASAGFAEEVADAIEEQICDGAGAPFFEEGVGDGTVVHVAAGEAEVAVVGRVASEPDGAGGVVCGDDLGDDVADGYAPRIARRMWTGSTRARYQALA